MNQDSKYWIWLSKCFPFGSILPAEMIRKYGAAKEVYARRHELPKEFSLSRKEADLVHSLWADDCLKIMEENECRNIRIICYEDDVYPSRLKMIDSPPMVLYAIGDMTVLQKRCVAVVGTRRPTQYAWNAAHRIADDLAKRGITVVSGCAEGIDTAAHRGSLENGKTAAILGTALDSGYPASNAGLKRTILEKGGLLITEYPLGLQTHPSMFPIRNRLIAGVSDAVILVQAPAKSGGLITARLAMEQGKDVFCLPPADIFSPAYEGGKALLQDGAIPYLGVRNIEEIYRYHSEPLLQEALQHHTISDEEAPKPEPMVSEAALEIWNALDDTQGSTVENLSQILTQPTAQIMAALTELEVVGAVSRKGNLYSKG